MYQKPFYSSHFVVIFISAFIVLSCSKPGNIDDEPPPPPPPTFPELPEDNTGSRTRSITYVYDRTSVDQTYPPKIDSSVIYFSYTPSGKIDRLRLAQNDSFFIYDFYFIRNSITNRLDTIRCKTWTPITYPTDSTLTDLVLQYDGSGKVVSMKFSIQNDPTNHVDTFIVKSSSNRIDTVIDRRLTIGTDADKYAFTYNASGDITQMDHIRTSGIFFVYEDIFKYTLSNSPAGIVLGDEAIFWNFIAMHVDISSNTDFMIPSILFHSAKQPSKLVLQVSGFYTGTYNYQTEYYATGKPKKMTANVTTQNGSFYAREAYYYTYTQ